MEVHRLNLEASLYIKVIGSRSRSWKQKAVSICRVLALNFECLDKLTWNVHFFGMRDIFGISSSGWYIKVIGSRSRSQE